VAGTGPSFASLGAGQIAAAMQAVPYVFQAQDAGPDRGYFINYLLSADSVRRSWVGKNRPLVVRFLKAVKRGKQWFE